MLNFRSYDKMWMSAWLKKIIQLSLCSYLYRFIVTWHEQSVLFYLVGGVDLWAILYKFIVTWHEQSVLFCWWSWAVSHSWFILFSPYRRGLAARLLHLCVALIGLGLAKSHHSQADGYGWWVLAVLQNSDCTQPATASAGERESVTEKYWHNCGTRPTVTGW